MTATATLKRYSNNFNSRKPGIHSFLTAVKNLLRPKNKYALYSTTTNVDAPCFSHSLQDQGE